MAKKVCSTILLCLWMVCIFAFSAQPAEKSTAVSNTVKKKVVEVVQTVSPKLAKKIDTPKNESAFIKFIRKSAHFFCYFVLGLLAVWMFSCYGIGKYRFVFAFFLCVLYAVSDEIHQIFVQGRAGRFLDVCIDSAGTALGLSVYYFSKKCKIMLDKRR